MRNKTLTVHQAAPTDDDTMDDDYLAVLKEELDEITIELNEVRAHREKQRKLIQVLQEERQALQVQKEERLKRSVMLLRIDNLQEQYDKKKEERNHAFKEVTDAVKACNRMLIATGRPPINEPVYGKFQPKRAEKRYRKKDEEDGLLKSFSSLPPLSPTPTAVDALSMPSFHPKRDVVGGSHPGAHANVAVSGILRKKDTPRANPKNVSVEKSNKKGKRKSNSRGRQPKVRLHSCEELAPRQNEAAASSPQESKPVKIDGHGDMTAFLDAIGYYSPEEEEDN